MYKILDLKHGIEIELPNICDVPTGLLRESKPGDLEFYVSICYKLEYIEEKFGDFIVSGHTYNIKKDLFPPWFEVLEDV